MKFFKRKLPALALALVMLAGMVPAVSAASTDISYSVKSGDTVTFDYRDFENIFEDRYDGLDLYRMEFTDCAGLDSYGRLYALDEDGDSVRLKSSNVADYWFYPSDSDVDGDYDLCLRDMYFEANGNLSGAKTVTLYFTLRGSDSSKKVNGTLEIDIGKSGSSGGSSGGSASGSKITYRASSSDNVEFDPEDFADVFEDAYDSAPRYVVFDTPTSSQYAELSLFYRRNASREYEFSRSELRNTYFYFDSDAYGDYPLDDISIATTRNFKDEVKLTFTVYGSGSRSVSGTLVLTPDGKTSSGSSTKGAKITYKADSSDNVEFDPDDFADVFWDEYDSDPRYVVFDNPTSTQYAELSLFYRRGASREYEFSRSELRNTYFYFDSDAYGDYPLEDISVATTRDFEDEVRLTFTVYGSGSRSVSGILILSPDGSSSGSSTRGDIEYKVEPGEEVEFDEDDFEEYFSDNQSGQFAYVEFTRTTDLSSSTGTIYYDYDYSDEEEFTASNLKNYKFYYYNYSNYGDYPLDDLSFVADDDFDGEVVLKFRAWSTNNRSEDGTLVIRSTDSAANSKGTITYEVASSGNIALSENDFWRFYDEKGGSGSLSYVTFPNASKLSSPNGLFYVGSDALSGTLLSWDSLEDYKFYYSGSYSSSGFSLGDLHFAAGRNYTKSISLAFRAWSSGTRYVDGTLVLKPGSGSNPGTVPGVTGGIVSYSTTYNSNLQLNPNDFSRFLKQSYPTAALQYVKLGGVPSTGTLYYNYYNTSSYGARQTALNAASVSTLMFYFSPTTAGQYSLSELTFHPNNKANYCETIPFTAYGSGGQAVSGTILISVTLSAVTDVYGAVPRNNAVNFPAANFYNVVLGGTGTALASIRLLKLPASTAGSVYLGSVLANTSAQYTYAASNQSISQLRFVPASGFTGSVEIPYMAYNASNIPIATGKFCLGVLNATSISGVKKFSDVTATTWCYKYVTELSDAGVIGGYANGTFRPNSSVTYGAALKLVMLAAGYAAPAAAGSKGEFEAYLAKARADGLVSGTVSLTKAITRLQMAQLAAKALKLSITDLPSVKPFTDSTDPYLQALNAAGIVEGYFSNGTSTYRPNNTLTRGQMSAIVWRMRQYRK